MQSNKSKVRALACGATLVVLLGSGISFAPTIASAAEDTDASIALVPNQGAKIVDAEGESLTTLSDTEELGERVILAKSKDGEPARIAVQSAPVESLADVVPTEAGESTEPYVEQEPEAVTEEITSELIADDPAAWETTSSYATTPTTASFRWDEAVGGFTATINDGQAKVAIDGTVEFENLKPGSKYEVTLDGTLDESGDTPLTSQKTFQINTLRKETAKDGNFSIQTYQPYTTAYVHKTFIPPATVDGAMCNFGNNDYRFRGDNRGFRVPDAGTPYGTKDYRTMMFANVNWDNPAPYTLITVKDVGQSVTLKNGSVVHSSYAPSDRMKFEAAQSGGAYAQVRFNHAAANPHCQIIDVNYGGDIRYEETVRFYRSGVVEVVGYRRAAPAHEMYARFSNASGAETWTTISQRSNQGFKCLIEALCALDSYNLRKTY